MKIAAHLLAYNVNNTLFEVLKNISPHVDKIFIAYSENPWGYLQNNNVKRKNPTSLKFVEDCSREFNVEIIKGDWALDEDTRNACFDLAKIQGYDWFLQQDADEFYDESGWELIIKTLKNSTNETHYKTTWFNFWKSSEFVILDDKNNILSEKGNCAVRCLNSIKFIKGNLVNVQPNKTINAKCYHYGYVKNDNEMEEKIFTWGHAHEFNQIDWFVNKWLNWQTKTKNLNPTNPYSWTKAIKFEGSQPKFSDNFKKEINYKKLSSKDKLNDLLYDIKFFPKYYLRKIKKNFLKK